MIWSVDGIVRGFYVGDAMIVVQFIDQAMQSWFKHSGGLLYLGVGGGTMVRVA